MDRYNAVHPQWSMATTRRKDANKRGPGNGLWQAVAQEAAHICARCGDPVDPGLWSPRASSAHARAPWLVFRVEPRDYAGDFAAVPENLDLVHLECRLPAGSRTDNRRASTAKR